MNTSCVLVKNNKNSERYGQIRSAKRMTNRLKHRNSRIASVLKIYLNYNDLFQFLCNINKIM